MNNALRGDSPSSVLEERVAEGTRTPDHRDHNPGLYQLSYRHRGRNRIAVAPLASTYEDFNVLSRCSECLPSANSSSIFALNAGMSSGFRLVTSPCSTTTSWSTQVPPA